MTIDTSAIIAILDDEPERADFIELIEAAPRRLISSVSVLEASIVLTTRAGKNAETSLDLFLHRAAIEIVPFDEEQLRWARRAFDRFGKRRHPAALNFGDCIAYALAQSSGEPLLFKGTDFAATDVPQGRLTPETRATIKPYMFQGLEHTAISSPNPEKLAHWYVDNLGFHINFTYAGNYFVKAPNGSMLEIIPGEGTVPPQTMASNKVPGIRHLAIAIDDFDAAYELLKSKGVHFVAEPVNNMGNRLAFFTDGDGNLLHLIKRETPLP